MPRDDGTRKRSITMELHIVSTIAEATSRVAFSRSHPFAGRTEFNRGYNNNQMRIAVILLLRASRLLQTSHFNFRSTTSCVFLPNNRVSPPLPPPTANPKPGHLAKERQERFGKFVALFRW